MQSSGAASLKARKQAGTASCTVTTCMNDHPPRTPNGTPFSSKKHTRTPASRFISARGAVDRDLQFHQLRKTDSPDLILSPSQVRADNQFESHMTQTVFGSEANSDKVLRFTQKPPRPNSVHTTAEEQLMSVYSKRWNNKRESVVKKTRYVSTSPEKVLDAPNLVDDFYLNLLDWSVDSLLAVGLGHHVYLWNSLDGQITLLMETENADDIITSLNFIDSGSHIAIGKRGGEIQIWDIQRQKQTRMFEGHESRVGSLAWNRHILSSGSRDTQIRNHDVRVQDHFISSLRHHQQEVCGLEWSLDGSQLASGGNDNLVCVWELSMDSPRFVFSDHQAAVKALAWSPHQNHLLATGGGTADRHIRFWNTTTGACVNSVDTKSQVCNLIWNPFENEILSSHGFSQNQLTIWRCPSMSIVAELTGHTSRVLHAALSPDGTTVCSAAADETLRFWKTFQPVQKKARKKCQTRSRLKGMRIR